MIHNGRTSFVVAEIGSNHNGNIETAKELIKIAAWADADAVKLQKRHSKTLFTDKMYNMSYSGYGPTYGEHREALDFDFAQFKELKAYANDKGIELFATPFDIRSVEFLEKLGVPRYKVASALVTNHILLEKIRETNKPIFMSVGGHSFQDISKANDLFPADYPLTILHCIAAYPCPPEKMNLLRIPEIKKMYNRNVGLSDHQDGIALGAVAYTLGARVFEKHITLDHNAKGTDHRFSLEFFWFRQYIKFLKDTQKSLMIIEQPMKEEIAPIRKMSQSLYWIKDLSKNYIIKREDIAIQSPRHSNGLHPTNLTIDKFTERKLAQSVKKGDLVAWKNIK